MSKRLDGKVAVVTGAGGGIGRAYARGLAEEGARVVATDLDSESAEATAAALTDAGLHATSHPADVADAAQLATLAEHTKATFGPAEILVNNAAVFSRVPMSRSGFDEISEDEWDLMMRVNLKGMWLACTTFVPHMREVGRGKIINISSGTAFKGSSSRIHYVTSKAGVLGFTRVLAREVGGDHINVNTLAPGSTRTEAESDERVNASRQQATGDRAIPRVETADDLIGAVTFLASPESDFITGQALVVDGGSYMH